MPTLISKRLRVILTSASLVTMLGLGGLSLAGGDGTPAKQAAPTPTACKKDADCVLVPDDCCSCTEGGKQHAIARSGKRAYEATRNKRCAGTMCMQMMSQDPSCSKRAVCNAGSCDLAEPLPGLSAPSPAPTPTPTPTPKTGG